MKTVLLDDLKLLIFDLDGVLADTSDCHEQAYGDLSARGESRSSTFM